jgi:GntR family transcriptional regulator / MocR family aminotransferase
MSALYSVDTPPAQTAPLYLQIKEQLRAQIASGTLAAGSRLPSSRQLAADLGVSRITVTNAYAELEADGLIVSRTGSGTYVAPQWELPRAGRTGGATGEAALPQWQRRLLDEPVVGAVHPAREALVRRSQRSDPRRKMLSFAQARGDARLFPEKEFRRIVSDFLRDPGAAFGYEPPEGSLYLRTILSQYLKQQGIAATADEIVITSGAQQAFDLLSRLLVQPGDRVVTEAPTFVGALEALECRRARVIGVPMDAEGIDPRGLERALAEHAPRLVYLVPTFHNPTGVVTGAARRREIVALAQRYGVPVVEDEYLREVRFGSPIPPPLAAFDGAGKGDSENHGGSVVHVGSFSKSLSPAFRLGYMVVRGPLRERVVSLKRATDICCSPILQHAAARFLEEGLVYAHWKRVSRAYRKRQAAMIAAVQRHFPRACSWTAAHGGVVLWVRVPEGVSPARLLEEAQREGVTFTPGAVFFPEPADQPYLRLTYAALDEGEIERGVAILGRLLHRQLAGGARTLRAS